MSFLGLRAYARLIQFDLYLACGSFSAFHRKVRRHQTATRTEYSDRVEQICAAVDLACIWYWKEALCLQRSAATVCLLRDCGVPAQMVVGAQQRPFKAHAWVEVDGRVVNDKPYMPETYGVLERC